MATFNERDPRHGARTSLILELMNVHDNLRKVEQLPLRTTHEKLLEDMHRQRILFAHRWGKPDWSDVNWQAFDKVIVGMISTLGASIEAVIKNGKAKKRSSPETTLGPRCEPVLLYCRGHEHVINNHPLTEFLSTDGIECSSTFDSPYHDIKPL